MLNTAYEFNDERPATRERGRVEAHRDTGLFFSGPDVDGAYETFRAKGVEVEKPKIAPYGMKQMYFVDPDGYGLCFQWQV